MQAEKVLWSSVNENKTVLWTEKFKIPVSFNSLVETLKLDQSFLVNRFIIFLVKIG